MNRRAAIAAIAVCLVALGLEGVAVAAAPGRNSQQPGRGSSKSYRPRPVAYPQAPEFPVEVEAIVGPRYASGELERRVDRVSPGGTVLLEEGVYEAPVTIDKPVRIEGFGKAVIDAGGQGTVLTVKAPDVGLSGLVVRGSGIGPVGGPTGIRVEADRTKIINCYVYDIYTGIGVYGATGTEIVGNVVKGRGRGAIVDEGHATGSDGGSEYFDGERIQRGDAISFWDSSAILVRGNRVLNSRDGIYTSFGAEMLIDSNLVETSRYAVHTMFTRDVTAVENGFRRNLSGAVLMYGGPVFMLRNAIERNHSPSTGFGVLIKDVNAVDLNSNVLVENRVGVSLEGQSSPATKVTMNTIALNQIGVLLQPTAQAVFSINSLVDNTTQVVARGTEVLGKNEWFERGIGNYWSNYKGYDHFGEGFGDVEHAEGGSVAALIAKNPVLEALASSTAFRMVGAVEDRWAGKRPVALDPKPMMEPRSPKLEVEEKRGVAVLGRILAVTGLLGGLLLFFRLRVPANRFPRGEGSKKSRAKSFNAKWRG